MAEAEGMEIATPIAANAAPSGPVHAAAYRSICDAICDAVRAGCDVCFLDLHGAMVTEETVDGEGELLARLREIAPDLPIGVSLDLHGNLTDEIVHTLSPQRHLDLLNAPLIVGYGTLETPEFQRERDQSVRIMLSRFRLPETCSLCRSARVARIALWRCPVGVDGYTAGSVSLGCMSLPSPSSLKSTHSGRALCVSALGRALCKRFV